MFDDPGVNGAEAELGEANRQHARGRAAGITPPGIRAIAEHDPDGGGLEVRIDVAEPNHTDRTIVFVRREHSQYLRAALHGDLQPFRGDELPPVAEIEPLIVLLPAEPSGDQPKEIGRVNRLELHG